MRVRVEKSKCQNHLVKSTHEAIHQSLIVDACVNQPLLVGHLDAFDVIHHDNAFGTEVMAEVWYVNIVIIDKQFPDSIGTFHFAPEVQF